ncbi:MAG: D-alanyl-D-alanine carboxypeptidase [Ruminococcus sp.]|nr:D-alanyl-D-alanine carboxypeptidase [Ruminococcus sp.]
MVLIIVGIVFIVNSCSDSSDSSRSAARLNAGSVSENTPDEASEPTTEPEPTTAPGLVYPSLSPTAVQFSEEFDTKYAVLIDTETNEIIAHRNPDTIMYPASLTKIMTLIVAVENIEDLSDTVEITADMIDPMIDMEASRAGFVAGETPTMEQVLYGMMLPSGADASLAAAKYVAGSEAAFVELMNSKAQEIGLKNTHFTNPVGLHDENHYSTAVDMALILEYALRDETCQKIMSTYQYYIPPTEYNPEGITLYSTMFSRMEGTEMPGVTIKGGKTGFTDQAGQCLANYAEANGKTYIMVLAGGTSRWKAVYDSLSGYSIYCVGGQAYDPPPV